MQGSPQDPLSRAAEDRHRRPERVERISWWELVPHRGRRLGTHWGDQLVPLEAVQAGDRQVLAAADPARGGYETVLSLDELAAQPAVESVVASATVTARRPLRHIRELLVVGGRAQLPDQDTFVNLPRLESLHALAAPTRRQARLEWLPSGLRELAIGWSASEPDRLGRLGELSGLRRLVLDAGPATDVAGLAQLRRLTYLHLRQGKRGWRELGELPDLEEVHLLETGLRDLSAASGWPKLRSLSLSGREFVSLDGMAQLPELEACRLDWLALSDLAPLQGLARLAELELDALVDVPDLSGLDCLPALRRLVISGAVEREWRIASLEPLARLKAMEEVSVGFVAIGDRSIAPLAKLPMLKRLTLFPLSPLRDLDRFRAERPDVQIDDRTAPSGGGGEITVGLVTIHPPLEPAGPWWILQDLSSLLSTATNAEAVDALKQRLQGDNPALLNRLEFDTEAATVCIQGTEPDLRAVAAFVGARARPGHP